MDYNKKTDTKHIFSFYHPAVIFTYFAAVIILTMSTMNPSYVALSFFASSAYVCYLKGFLHFAKGLLTFLPVILAVTVINTLWGGLGLTVILSIYNKIITLEALVYGLCSAFILVSVIQWFSAYSEVMTSDKFLTLFGRVMPVTAMMITMVFRYVPETIRKGKQISAAQNALITESKKQKRFIVLRLCTVLVSWCMEDSIDTAAHMRARGFGGKITRFSSQRVNCFDAVCIVILACLSAVAAVFVFARANSFVFYPYLSTPDIDIAGLLSYAVLLFFPLILQAKEEIKWVTYR